MFLQDVVTDHPKLGLAVGHIDRHIRVAHQQSPGPAANAGHHQLTIAGLQHRREIQASGREAANRVLEQGSLGQRDGDHGWQPEPGL